MTLATKIIFIIALIVSIIVPFGYYLLGEKSKKRYKRAIGTNAFFFFGAFAIAGADRKFVWADAKIDGKDVLVSSPKVKDPKYVRYAYAGYRGDCNLQNREGLPAYPFRSDAYDYLSVK